jgi:hypothetical protein
MQGMAKELDEAPVPKHDVETSQKDILVSTDMTKSHSSTEDVLSSKKDVTKVVSPVTSTSYEDTVFRLKEQALDAQIQLKTKQKAIEQLEVGLKQKEGK